MMRKIFLGIAVLSFLFSSCEDYLEEENLSNVTGEEFYATEEGFESLVNANYSQLREIYGNEPWLFSAGTDLYAEGRDAEPPGLSRYTQLNPASEGVGHLYNTGYRAVQVANMALHFADLTEETPLLDNRVGEVKYLRANAYFLMVQTYGGVGLVTDYISNPVLQFDRNSAEEVYSFIIAELEEALNLVEEEAYAGRVNKRAVRHLLAKVYLTRGYEDFGDQSDFTTAANYADEAIAGQDLNLSFEEVWWPGNELNEEVIFSVQYDDSSVSTDPFELGHMQSSYFGPYQGGSEVAGDAPYRTYTLTPTQFAIDLYSEDDERWDATFMVEVFDRYFDYYEVEDHSTLGVSEYYAPQWESSAEDQAAYEAAHPGVTYHPYGSYVPSENPNFDYETIPVKKFDDPSAPFGESTSTRDIILSRLAETYLIAAEAYFQAGDAATGLMRLNEVRERAGVEPATMADFDIDFILDERARELLGEYQRWFDLKRTGTLVERASAHHFLVEESNFAGNNGELKILRPIPQAAMDLNQNQDFPQNPAYQ
ncbi:RagB/SusD family nutrient uptake outer membrane protein [Salegentibacter sp. F188]|uniref:RagB/SusD family nutrient uptake outer membrane protein n=1 Tax=Autumnicola patrickiae TaxID=3075591 RepID=A0ABU3DYV4_9FLAO|nr:RagB/SusD family nutrient uptake outer membrane protein [Salegentibacter sp. F188]MDT0688897.1 RagB/SusD family nutrient uptake outer membrane protein [Salegentibacter sp. F188]